MKAAVLVLGELGRSPRMQYHCLSLAKRKADVTFIGYPGSNPHPEIIENHRITQRYLRRPLKRSVHGLFFPFLAFYKILYQFFSVLWALLRTDFDLLVIQNPPCIPVFFSVFFYKLLTFYKRSKYKILIDWHNLGYSLLGLHLRGALRKIIMPIVTLYEHIFGRWVGDYHICVSQKFKEYLQERQIDATVLYDRPNSLFQPLSFDEKRDFFTKYKSLLCLEDNHFVRIDASRQTGPIRIVSPYIFVTPTSYTPDEDVKMFLRAADMLSDCEFEVRCVITGKGPMYDEIAELVSEFNEKHTNVKFSQAFLPIEDYPKLLSCADMGVSFHYSSSGIDLPMKVVDMFGVGLPSASIEFPALPELIRDNETGFVFKNEEDLSNTMKICALDPEYLAEISHNMKEDEHSCDWDTQWDAKMPELLSFFEDISVKND
ncbi:hypothetical protein PCE1_000874 [Barthelona sp. PCE]